MFGKEDTVRVLQGKDWTRHLKKEAVVIAEDLIRRLTVINQTHDQI